MKLAKRVMLACFLLVLGGGILFAGGKGQQGGAAGQKRILKWTGSATPEHYFSIYTEMAIKELHSLLPNLEIQYYPSAQLAGDVDGVDLVRSGGADLITVGIHGFAQFAEELQGCMMPFSFPDNDGAVRYFIDYVTPNYMNDPARVRAMNMYTLGILDGGSRHTSTKGIAVRRPQDLAGQKVRSMEPPMAIATVKALGGSPVPVAFAELYMALQTGTVVAQENPLNTMNSIKIYEVQDYLILTEHAINMNMMMINSNVWQSLTDNERQTFQSVITKYQDLHNEKIKADQADLLKLLESRGMKVIADIDKQAFIDHATRVIAEDFKDARYDSWRAMRQHALDWIAANK